MKYAVIGLDGKQIKVSEGQTFKVNSQSKLKFDVSIIKTTRDRKIIVSRFKAKSRYRKTRGVKQPISFIKIESIEREVVVKKATAKPKKPVIAVKKVKKAKVKE